MLYKDPLKQKSKLSSIWSDKGVISKIGFKSAEVYLDDGRKIVSNVRRLKKFLEGSVGG